MSDPINKKFFDEIENRLGNIKIANGYKHNIGKIDRARLVPFKGYDLPAANIWATKLGNAVTAFGADQRDLPVYIEYHNKTSDIPFVDLCDIMAKDLITALNRSTDFPAVTDEESIDLGGICDDLIFGGYDYQVGQEQEPFCAILAQFTVRYTAELNTL